MTKVALSGAAGQLGRILRSALLARGVDLRSAAGSKPLEPSVPGEDVMHGDLRDTAVVDRLMQGVDVLIHMAGTSVERPLRIDGHAATWASVGAGNVFRNQPATAG